MHWSKKIAIEILVVIQIGLVMGFLGPFGTYAMRPELRFPYWVIVIIIGYTIFRPISVVSHWLRNFVHIPMWTAELLACAVAGLPLALLINFMFGFRKFGYINNLSFTLLYLQCVVIGFGIYLLMRIIFDSSENDETIMPDIREEHIAPSRSALHEYLPAGFPDRIDALQSEDHYVHVYARDECGHHKEMILMRLSDAINFLDGDGFQTHRSWWIARHAASAYKRDGRKHYFATPNGQKIPISKSYIASIKQASVI